MARPVDTSLPLLLLAAASCLLFQVADCSRPSSSPARTKPRKQHDVVVVPHVAPLFLNVHGAGTGGAAAAAAADVVAEEGEATSRVRDANNNNGGTATSSSSSSATTSHPNVLLVGKKGDNDDDGFVSAGGGNNWKAAALLRSKLARRFLATDDDGVVQGVDSAAGSSCHSNDVHNKTCPPASKG